MRKIIFGLLILCLSSISSFAQLTFRVISIPANTPPDSDIFVAGNFNNWQPGSAEGMLQPDSSGNYFIELDPAPGALQFKFTRGEWSSVEATAQGGFRPNRTLTYDGQDTIVDIQIAGWEDLGGSQGSTASPNVSILDAQFFMPQLNRSRRIWLYLPPDYDTTEKRYPVLYMQDGQNLFDVRTSFAGEWKVDEHLDSLFLLGDPGCIVVGIDNGGANRINEYSPWVHPQHGGGQGDDYMDFIIETLKPHIDENYRTLTDAANTGIIGSSMGGLISFYGGITRQDVFGKIGAFSNSFWFSSASFSLPAEWEYQDGTKIYMIAGAMEGSGQGQVRDMERMHDSLNQNNYPESQVIALADPTGTHSESYWARSFTAAYQWLFSSTTSTQFISLADEGIIPTYRLADRSVNWTNEKNIPLNYQLSDTQGKVILQGSSREGAGQVLLNEIVGGVYFFTVYTSNSRETIKVLVY